MVQNESENILVEANNEQEPISPIHQDWLTVDEQTARDDQNINNEVMRRIQRRYNPQPLQSTSLKEGDAVTFSGTPETPAVIEASDSEEEDEKDYGEGIPKL